MPFLTDEFNHSVKRLLIKHNIPARLINNKGYTLRDMVKAKPRQTDTQCKSKTSPAPGIYHKTNVVYRATCTLCNCSYIGMTTRRLHERAREHVAAAKQRSKASAIGEHYWREHTAANGDIAISFEIVRHERNNLRLHIEEALAILKYKPGLKRCQGLDTGFLPWTFFLNNYFGNLH